MQIHFLKEGKNSKIMWHDISDKLSSTYIQKIYKMRRKEEHAGCSNFIFILVGRTVKKKNKKQCLQKSTLALRQQQLHCGQFLWGQDSRVGGE